MSFVYKAGTLLLLTWLLTACGGQSSNAAEYLDRGRLQSEALGLASAWVNHAPKTNGFQRTKFNGLWEPSAESTRVDLTSQARLIYVYAAAFDLTGDENYRYEVRNAADFMLTNMRTENGSGWYKSVDANGAPTRRSVHRYGYAFAIFGMAHAFRITGDSRYLQLALATWQSGVWTGLKAARAFRANRFPPVAESEGAWSQNPYMHLFEALLVLHEVTQSQKVWADINAMALFLEKQLIQPCGCLPEWFEAGKYVPLDKGSGVGVYHGHQVEWAFLLSKAVDQGLDRRYLGVADKLLDFAINHGLDLETGGLKAESKMDGYVTDASYSWWVQAELMRVAVHFARYRGRSELWQTYEGAHLFARIHYIDQDRGGWSSSSPLHTGKADRDLRKVIGYHAMAFYMEALEIAP